MAQACPPDNGGGGGDVPIAPLNPAIKESITAIFTGLDGSQVGSRDFSDQENVIVSGTLNSVNSIRILVITPSNLCNFTCGVHIKMWTNLLIRFSISERYTSNNWFSWKDVLCMRFQL